MVYTRDHPLLPLSNTLFPGPMSPKTKEMIARLQKENENLRLQVDEKGISDTDLELLREELKDA